MTTYSPYLGETGPGTNAGDSDAYSMGVYEKNGVSGIAPVWTDAEKLGPWDNPLPHVLMLTAIVVSVSTLAVAVALIVNIKRKYGTIEDYFATALRIDAPAQQALRDVFVEH